MKRTLTALFIILGLAIPGIALTSSVYAVDVIAPACKDANGDPLTGDREPAVCKDNSSGTSTNPIFGPDGILTTVVNLLSVIAGVIALFVILIGGVKMITSAGESASVASARSAVLYAVISLAIIASAQAIVRFILNKIG